MTSRSARAVGCTSKLLKYALPPKSINPTYAQEPIRSTKVKQEGHGAMHRPERKSKFIRRPTMKTFAGAYAQA